MIEENISRIERYLNSSLKPVKPNPDYIGRLQKQLSTAKNVILEYRPQTMILSVLLTGIIAGALLLYLIRPSRKGKAH
jgi:hypothetical protein